MLLVRCRRYELRALWQRCCSNSCPTPLHWRSGRAELDVLPRTLSCLFSSSACQFQKSGSYSFDWEEPFEETEDSPTGTEKKNDISNGRGQTGRLSRQLMRLADDMNVTSVLDQWIEEGNVLSKNMVIVALTNLKRHRRYKQALEVADFVYSKNVFEHDDTDYMYRLYFTGQVGSIQDIERCFTEVPEKYATEKVHNQLISCYMARGLIVEAEKARQKLHQSGKIVSTLVYSQFLSLYANQRQDEKAFQTLNEMTKANIKPDTKIYNILLNMVMKQGDSKKALNFYNAMREAGVPPDSLTNTIVIKAYMSLGMEKEAFELTEEMINCTSRDHSLENDLLIAVYADLGKEKQLKLLWSRIQSSSKLSARTYGVMIESLGKLGLIQEAEDLAFKAERKTGRLIVRVVNALLCVYARHGRMEAAEKLMMQVSLERLRPNAVTYSHLIFGYLNMTNVEKALDYLKTSRESLTYDQSKPWFRSFLHVLDHVAERGDIELTEHIFETFTSAGVYRSTSVYNILLKAYLKSNRLAKKFLQRMSDDGFEPDHETLAMLAQMQSFSSEVCENGVM